MKAKREANLEEYRQKHRDWVAAHPGHNKRQAAKQRTARWAALLLWNARRSTYIRANKGRNDATLEITLTEEDILAIYERQGGLCYWFGVKMIPSQEKRDPRRPSLDRLNNDKGYTPDNVVLSCMAANVGRSESTHEAFAAFCASITRASTNREVVETEL
jgi:hypothetical protein